MYKISYLSIKSLKELLLKNQLQNLTTKLKRLRIQLSIQTKKLSYEMVKKEVKLQKQPIKR